jgi:hypothetical protein
VRRLLAIVLAAALLSVAAATAAASITPVSGDYGGTSSRNHHVHFHVNFTDRAVRNFYLGSIHLFTSAHLLEDGNWCFEHNGTHYRLHGCWSSPTTVHGSICHMPNGSILDCQHADNKQTYSAALKT